MSTSLFFLTASDDGYAYFGSDYVKVWANTFSWWISGFTVFLFIALYIFYGLGFFLADWSILSMRMPLLDFIVYAFFRDGRVVFAIRGFFSSWSGFESWARWAVLVWKWEFGTWLNLGETWFLTLFWLFQGKITMANRLIWVFFVKNLIFDAIGTGSLELKIVVLAGHILLGDPFLHSLYRFLSPRRRHIFATFTRQYQFLFLQLFQKIFIFAAENHIRVIWVNWCYSWSLNILVLSHIFKSSGLECIRLFQIYLWFDQFIHFVHVYEDIARFELIQGILKQTTRHEAEAAAL